MGMLWQCRRRHSHSLNIFSSETAEPVKAKHHVEHPKDGGTNGFINGPGHMTKMTTRAINSQIL